MGLTLLKMNNISKSFSGNKVLNNVDLEIIEGEVHALMGENGAGKSTLMKILTGVYKKDIGEILYKNDEGKLEPRLITSPKMAQEMGISIVHQELNLHDNLSIAENIFLGREVMKRGNIFVSWDNLKLESTKLLERVGLDLDPGMLVSNLSVAQKQLVEIAKALSFKSKVIIMDEPTATLTRKDTIILFELIEKLRSQGISIIYISHRMEEIFKISQKITIMRNGNYIKTLNTADTDINEVIRLMVGRSISHESIRAQNNNTDEKVILEVKNLTKAPIYKNISFKLHKGKILGVFGLVGSGRSDVMKSIFGAESFDEGEIIIDGRTTKINSVKDAINAGLSFVPEDRRDEGLVLGLNVTKNLSITKLPFYNWFLWRNKSEENITKEYIERLSIRTNGPNQISEELSGGNQQKIVIAKWLSISPKVLILDEPTRGIDVGAKDEIYKLINSLADKGMSVLVVSSELPEIFKISDRVMVVHEGRVTLIEDIEKLDSEIIMQAAVGRTN